MEDLLAPSRVTGYSTGLQVIQVNEESAYEKAPVLKTTHVAIRPPVCCSRGIVKEVHPLLFASKYHSEIR